MTSEAYEYRKMLLKMRAAYPIEIKVAMAKRRILEWGGRFSTYISFSGGMDSTYLLYLVRSIYQDIPAVFCDTGLEYPEIRRFAKSIDNVITIRPLKTFQQVIEEYGYPIISKEVSKIIYGAKNSKYKKQSYLNRLKGLNPDGSYSSYKQQYKKWEYLLDCDIPISNRCCYWIKEKPFIEYEKEYGAKPFIGTTTEESIQRADGWIKTGCNAFNSRRQISKPISFFTRQDILKEIKEKEIPYCKEIYGDIVPMNSQESLFDDVKLQTTLADRTGCMYCMYGVHLEKEPNRFQRMKITHPNNYDYGINTMNCGKAMDYVGVPY